MLEIIGYICCVLIGVTLGLLGSGGSILTVPVMVYLFGIDPVLATAYSLVVVGLTSLVGSAKYMNRKQVDYKTGFIFAIPSLLAVYITRRYIVPAIPDVVFSLNAHEVSKGTFIMVLFALLMVAAAYAMIKPKRFEADETKKLSLYHFPIIGIEGFVVGVLTGLVGAGGGFLIIPALVLLAKVPMRLAIGTSLMIIAIKSLLGFLGDVTGNYVIDWHFIGTFSVFSVIGIFIGMAFVPLIPIRHLKPAFGWFVLAMALYILVKEIFLTH